MQSTYDIYRQWCLDTGRIPPTREWWDHACSLNTPVMRAAERSIGEADFDMETEQREGWGYD